MPDGKMYQETDPSYPLGDTGRFRVTARKRSGELWAQEQTGSLQAAIDRMEWWESRGLMVSGEDLQANHALGSEGSQTLARLSVVEPDPMPLITTRDKAHNNTVFAALLMYASNAEGSESKARAFAMLDALHAEYPHLEG